MPCKVAAKNPRQREAVVAFAKAYTSNFGKIEEVRDATDSDMAHRSRSPVVGRACPPQAGKPSRGDRFVQ